MELGVLVFISINYENQIVHSMFHNFKLLIQISGSLNRYLLARRLENVILVAKSSH
ncbi:unnamed protein product [Acidithrix sp. C25]|nr:unnamed protein product [Acidithrix sp. C25]